MVTFFDVTTLYFESQKADGLRKFGFSKDCKFNEVQVLLSLLINQNGMPIACEVFQGNTYEGHTLVNYIATLKDKYKLNKAVIVADRGLYSAANLNLISSMGFEYIVGTKLRNSKKCIKDQVLSEEGYKYIHNPYAEGSFKYKTLSTDSIDNKQKIVAAWSEKCALKDAKDRDRLLRKA